MALCSSGYLCVSLQLVKCLTGITEAHPLAGSLVVCLAANGQLVLIECCLEQGRRRRPRFFGSRALIRLRCACARRFQLTEGFNYISLRIFNSANMRVQLIRFSRWHWHQRQQLDLRLQKRQQQDRADMVDSEQSLGLVCLALFQYGAIALV